MIEFKTIINKLSSITDKVWRDLTELFEEFTLNKHKYLITEGQKAPCCYYLKDGVIRDFYTYEGNEYNKTFSIPGTFPTPITALLSGNPSQLSFQVLAGFSLVFVTGLLAV